MRHEKKFEGFPRPTYTVLHADLLHRSEEFAWGTDPWLMPMARHGVPPALSGELGMLARKNPDNLKSKRKVC